MELFNVKKVGLKNAPTVPAELSFLNSEKYVAFPGFCDVHVHFREPGFSYKETIFSGSRAAARGGYTAVLTMPNLDPVPDSLVNLKKQTDIIEKDSAIAVYPYGSITVGEKGERLSDMDALAPKVIAFSDDGRGVQDEGMMREAMEKAKDVGKMIVAHCEVNDLLRGGYIHDGEYAAAHGHRGISSASEYKQIERDLKLAEETGCAYHVCHISAKESVELIRSAKRSGVNVTCETAPHYLILTDEDLKEEGRFKMNPPLRGIKDKEALIEGCIDGTIDMIATDHAPHSEEEKGRGLEKSLFGIVGMETAFPLMVTHLVKKGILPLERVVEMLTTAPRERFHIPQEGWSIWELEREETVNPADFLSMGCATPFSGEKLFGKCMLTSFRDKIVYKGF